MLDYIMTNYIWFLGGIIIIFLAIIGYFADKTNFGQGKSSEKEKKELNNNYENKTLQDVINSEVKEQKVVEEEIDQEQVSINEQSVSEEENVIEGNLQQQESINNEQIQTITNDKEIIEAPEKEVINQSSFEDSFAKFDKEFEEILPKKEIIEDEFLDEIDNLELDKTQKIDLGDIPDLDDVDLPKIKKLESEVEDVWKF